MQNERKVISLDGMDLAELELQLKEFQPPFNKTSERGKLTRADQFKKQALIKLDAIRDVEKKRGEHRKNIAEYLSYLADLGFVYKEPELMTQVARTMGAAAGKAARDLQRPDKPEDVPGDPDPDNTDRSVF